MSNNYQLSTVYGSLAAGNQPLSDFDVTNGQLAAMGTLMCSASGTNTITLSSLSGYPTMTALGNIQKIGFIAASTSTGSVTIQYASLSVLNAYEQDGVTQVGAGAHIAGYYYEYAYNSTLNSSSGGWQLIGGQGSQLIGSVLGDTALPGNVGEYASATIAFGSAVSLTSITPATITSVTLTAGDWDVWGVTQFAGNTATTVSFLQGAISSVPTAINEPWIASVIGFDDTIFNYGSSVDFSIMTQKVTPSITTSYYLNAQANFGANTCSAYGGIFARRRR